jgi:hypothetical protein
VHPAPDRPTEGADGGSTDAGAARSVASARSRAAEARRILLLGAAVGVPAAAYLLFLRHRTDYPGHLLAGYGGTLGALGLGLFVAPRAFFLSRAAPLLVLLGTLACVGLGAVAEATVFRIAQFDPVDFFNQSIGAALAGLSIVLVLDGERPPPATVAVGLLLSIASLAAGFLLAFH